jgi:hypothetical protein
VRARKPTTKAFSGTEPRGTHVWHWAADRAGNRGHLLLQLGECGGERQLDQRLGLERVCVSVVLEQPQRPVRDVVLCTRGSRRPVGALRIAARTRAGGKGCARHTVVGGFRPSVGRSE